MVATGFNFYWVSSVYETKNGANIEDKRPHFFLVLRLVRNRPHGLAILLPHADNRLIMHAIQAPVQVAAIRVDPLWNVAKLVQDIAGSQLT